MHNVYILCVFICETNKPKLYIILYYYYKEMTQRMIPYVSVCTNMYAAMAITTIHTMKSGIQKKPNTSMSDTGNSPVYANLKYQQHSHYHQSRVISVHHVHAIL